MKPVVARDTVDDDVVLHGKPKSERIDLGLDVLLAVRPAGICFSATEIAAWCGCTNEAIRRIEAAALRKLRKRLRHEAI